ncbi:EpsG family protein [Acinetobacter variabilis]|uniref:EpsG family protein n=1 Tax=Acinetobacter variabilis TaxID=70346 RepID=UPI001BD5D7E5|nr:EpsG family protein [Acinetobacter variabilis]
MKNLFIFRKNLFSLIVFLLSPALGVLTSLHNLKREHLRFFYILISMFFAILVLKNPPIYDLYRYLEMFDISASTTEFGNYYSYYILSKLFKNLGISFYFLPPLFVFLTILYNLKSLHLLYEKFNWNLRKQLILIFAVIIISNPLIISLGLRSYLSSALFTYSVLQISLNREKKYYSLIILSIFIHFSALYLTIFFLISRFIKIKKITALIISILALTLSSIVIPYFIQYIPIASIQEHSLNYTNNQFTGIENTSKSFNALIVNNFSYFIIIFFWILFYIKKSASNPYYNDYKNILNFFSIAICLSSVTGLIFYRFSSYLIILLFIYIATQELIFIKNKLSISLITIILTLNLVLIDIFIRKDSIINGKPLQMAFLPTPQILIYTDHEYRKFLNKIDDEGYIIK